jgi:RNA polymerase sigma-70 factor (ECF subfamily)
LSGDSTAFDTLVDRHRAGLLRFVRSAVGYREDEVEDLAQETLLQAYRGLVGFQGRSRFRTWLFGVARNVCSKHRRAPTAWSRLRNEGPEPLLELRDPGPDPLVRLERTERRAAVWSHFQRLPAGQRMALLLREAEGLSYAEIAEVLRVPMGTVRSRIHNARAQLAESLLASSEVADEL